MDTRILVELFWPQRRHLARAFGFLDRHLDTQRQLPGQLGSFELLRALW